jgi:hypothetical protein
MKNLKIVALVSSVLAVAALSFAAFRPVAAPAHMAVIREAAPAVSVELPEVVITAKSPVLAAPKAARTARHTAPAQGCAFAARPQLQGPVTQTVLGFCG